MPDLKIVKHGHVIVLSGEASIWGSSLTNTELLGELYDLDIFHAIGKLPLKNPPQIHKNCLYRQNEAFHMTLVILNYETSVRRSQF